VSFEPSGLSSHARGCAAADAPRPSKSTLVAAMNSGTKRALMGVSLRKSACSANAPQLR
jgi:hypothetical protein